MSWVVPEINLSRGLGIPADCAFENRLLVGVVTLALGGKRVRKCLALTINGGNGSGDEAAAVPSGLNE